MTHQAHIRVRDLDVLYGGFHALKNISVGIPANQITAIIGPSGCGKTTLLKNINRLIDLTDEARVSGEILVDGRSVLDPQVDVTEVRKKVGMLSQRPYPLPMSIYENVGFGPRIHGLCKGRSLDETVEHYLRLVGLWEEVRDRLDAPAAKLSIGQQQRLCLARGLAVEPGVLLGDEPTSALDPKSAAHRAQPTGTEARLHRGHRHSCPAAGSAGGRLCDFPLHGRAGGGRAGQGDLRASPAAPHSGIPQRRVQLNSGFAIMLGSSRG
jgi:phosphate transport system ATP-binding protein